MLDLIMPGMTGFEVLERLEEAESTRAIPVIVYTSKALERDEAARLEGRAAAVLSKQSTSAQSMRDAVERACRAEAR